MRILIVDDEVVALNALKKRVDWVSYGFTDVLTASSISEAKAILAQQKIDLMLCDIEMRGENGLTLVKCAREYYPETSCIMVTCHADFSYIKESMKYKVSDYILKPIDYEELAGVLEQFLKEHHEKNAQKGIEKIVEQTKEVRKEPTENDSDRVRTVKQYIEEHIREKIYAEDLAKLVHLNEQHLMRIFKRETGYSLVEYISERRIVIASSLLKDTEHSINFIADCVGCENYSYFTKLFKKMTGFTPREYRAQFKKA